MSTVPASSPSSEPLSSGTVETRPEYRAPELTEIGRVGEFTFGATGIGFDAVIFFP